MPELPEVETTVRGLKKEVVGLRILDVWTDLNTNDKRKAETLANPKYFKKFKNEIIGKKIISAERRAKNILINLDSGKTILVHLKMTGHLLVGKYKFLAKENKWIPEEKGPLGDPYNRFVHVVFSLSPVSSKQINNKKHLALSDMRKFGKITLLPTKYAHDTKHLKGLGLEPFEKNFTLENMREGLKRKPNGKIKTILMDQSVIAGIGNIYSDEILWRTSINPERRCGKIKEEEFIKIHKAIKELLKKGINLGGDSMSDYRNIYGLPGKFQLHHNAYRKTGEKCRKVGCQGVILRKIINGRSAHFCSKHQK